MPDRPRLALVPGVPGGTPARPDLEVPVYGIATDDGLNHHTHPALPLCTLCCIEVPEDHDVVDVTTNEVTCPSCRQAVFIAQDVLDGGVSFDNPVDLRILSGGYLLAAHHLDPQPIPGT